jgi:hypothetical protein
MEDTDPRGVWRPLASAWQGSAGVTTTVETQRVKQGKHSLKADFTSPGNGVYDHPTTGLWWEMGPNDWSCYNTLSYWVYVTDDDPAVKNRRLGTAVYNHGKRGGEQSAGHTVPVNQWTLIEEDIAFYFRDDVSEIRFFLYMSDPKKKEHYTFYFADMRLTKQAKSNPALTALLEQQAGPSDLLVLAYVDNPLTRPLAGRLSVELPEGWKVIPQSVFQVSVKAGRHVATPFCLVPAEGISGRKYPLKVRLSTKDGLELEATHEIEPLRVVLCPRADRPPAIDGAITDAAWKNAPHLSGFTLNDGSGLARAQTEAWVTADGENLYIAFKCLEPDMGSLRTRVKESNGPVWDDDHVEIFIQPRTEKPLCYRVVINPIETIRFETGRGSAVARHLRCKSRRSGDAWMIEIAIPFASLGGCPRKGDAWSFNLNRGRPARRGQPAEDSCWSCTYGSFYRPERFGTLSFE